MIVWSRHIYLFIYLGLNAAAHTQVVVKYGGQGQSRQAIKLFQAPRNISFTFRFWHKSFIVDDVKLAELSNDSFEWKNVTLDGVKTYFDPSYIF